MWHALKRKLQGDIARNLASFGFQAVVGILVNVLLGHFYGAEGVGILNQSLAVLFVASQLGSLGLHYSLLRFSAEHSLDRTHLASLTFAAFLLCTVTSSVVSLLTWLSIPLLGEYFRSIEMVIALEYTAISLWFFCMNKLLLGLFNGLKQMKWFAILQAGRYFFWLVGVWSLWIGQFGAAHVPLLILVGEASLFFVLLVSVILQRHLVFFATGWQNWARIHFDFGLRSFLSGSLIEANSRIDILVLGHFFSASVVGIYSFATLIFEGISQIGVVLRNQWNPELTQTILARDKPKLQESIRRGFRVSVKVLAPVLLLAVAFFPIFIKMATESADFAQGWIPFTILCVGLALVSGFQPFGMILLQGNYPGKQTIYLGLCALANLVFNILLVPDYGMLGAALGTTASLLISAVYLRWEVRRLWQVQLAP